MKKLNNYITGQISLELRGWGKDRLIKICKSNNIIIYDLKVIEDGYTFSVDSRDYKNLLEYNKKVCTQIEIKDKVGLPFFFYKYRKRKIFILCFLLFLLCIFVFSNYIWNITITGTEIYTEEELSKDITDNYISIGTAKKDVDCNQLEKDLRNKYPDIAWISCEIKGTNLIVNIEESVPMDNTINVSKPCNIVAYKDAIITDIIINKGSRVVNIGDEIKKNDILITGVVNIYNEYDELIETNYTNATGTILGIVKYDYKDEFLLEMPQKRYTGATHTSYNVNIFKNFFNIKLSKIKFTNFDTLSQENNLKLFDNLYLPFGIQKNTHMEYTIDTVKLSDNEAKEIAETRLIKYIENLKKKGVSILENNVTISIVNGKCISTGTIICKEIIGIPAILDITQEGEQE